MDTLFAFTRRLKGLHTNWLPALDEDHIGSRLYNGQGCGPNDAYGDSHYGCGEGTGYGDGDNGDAIGSGGGAGDWEFHTVWDK